VHGPKGKAHVKTLTVMRHNNPAVLGLGTALLLRLLINQCLSRGCGQPCEKRTRPAMIAIKLFNCSWSLFNTVRRAILFTIYYINVGWPTSPQLSISSVGSPTRAKPNHLDSGSSLWHFLPKPCKNHFHEAWGSIKWWTGITVGYNLWRLKTVYSFSFQSHNT
jgi:hypothetical protein